MCCHKSNLMKHILKLNIFPNKEDPNQIRQLQPTNWKDKSCISVSSILPEHFTSEDLKVINNHDLEKLTSLSIKGCSYSKSVIKHYSKWLWQSTINSQYQLEGYTKEPTVSTTKLKFPPKTSRQLETSGIALPV